MKRHSPRMIYVLVCRDGEPHMGKSPYIDRNEVLKDHREVAGCACGPHRIMLYRPAARARRRP